MGETSKVEYVDDKEQITAEDEHIYWRGILVKRGKSIVILILIYLVRNGLRAIP